MMRAVRIFALFTGLLACPALVFAQATITGIVRDASGGVLPGVTVEAASPVLIEKVRSVTTDSNGGYRIVDLRPGPYSVTFTLPGFNTFKRDGIELTGSTTVVVDGDLRVGAIEETITVTGEAPVVDVQSTTKQRVIGTEVIDTLPTGRSFATLGVLIPGVNSSGNDVGGSLGDPQASLSAHGGRANDQRILQNGSNLTDLQTAGGGQSGAVPNVGAAQEITIDFGSQSAEQTTGGVYINFIPRDGGNQFRSSTFVGFASEQLAGGNFTQRLKDRGLTSVNDLKKNWDVNPGFGGPLKQNQVWYYATMRYVGAQNYAAGMFPNRNAFNPNVWTYEADTSQRVLSLDTDLEDAQVRVTWQANAKHKFSGTWGNNMHCRCPFNISATLAPEAASDRRFPQQRTVIAEWKSPLTNNVLAEAVVFHKTLRWGTMHLRPPSGGGSLDVGPNELAAYARSVGVTEQTNGLNYHGPGTSSNGVLGAFNNTSVPNYTYRWALSYVTGAHNMKLGWQDSFGFLQATTYAHEVPYRYRFNNGVPNQITLFATPWTQRSEQEHDLGVFVQDRWTIDRLTVTGGLRFDWFKSGYPEQTLGPAPLVPNRNWTFAAEDNLDWKDFSWRSGATYDLTGDGKTAVKVSLNKFLAGQALGGLGSNTNPIGRLTNTTTRSWSDANRDFIPQCDLIAPAANGECGPLASTAFGTQASGQVRDLDLRTGWGKRGFNWEFSAGVQREILPRVSVDAGYFRRWYGNFAATDDLNVSPADFEEFSITAPRNPLLPDGGGQAISGLFDLRPTSFGRPSNNKISLSKNFGEQVERWHGVDLSAQARLQNGLLISGGLSTGTTTTDNCEILAMLPEMDRNATSTPYCHVETPFLTQIKGLASYTIPRVEVQVSGTFQSIPGNVLTAAYNATSAEVARSLGRPLAGNTANVTVPLIPTGVRYGERLNQIDVRIGKLVRIGRQRSTFGLDIYNLMNNDTVTATNNNYATLWRPTGIIQARFMKVSMQLEF